MPCRDGLLPSGRFYFSLSFGLIHWAPYASLSDHFSSYPFALFTLNPQSWYCTEQSYSSSHPGVLSWAAMRPSCPTVTHGRIVLILSKLQKVRKMEIYLRLLLISWFVILLFSATLLLSPLFVPAIEKMSSAFSVGALILLKLLWVYLVLLVPKVSASVLSPMDETA